MSYNEIDASGVDKMLINVPPILIYASRQALAGRLRTKELCKSSWSGISQLKTKLSHQKTLDSVLTEGNIEMKEGKMKTRLACRLDSNLTKTDNDLPLHWELQRQTCPPRGEPTIIYSDGSKVEDKIFQCHPGYLGQEVNRLSLS